MSKRQVGHGGEVVTKKEVVCLFLKPLHKQPFYIKLEYAYFQIRPQANVYLLISKYDSINHSGSLAQVIGLEAMRSLAVKSS